MTAVAWYFFALWTVTSIGGAWFFVWAWQRHERDLRLLRHMAQGQAELQRELAAVDASRCVH